MPEPTIEEIKNIFIKDTENHSLTILNNDGLYRHLSFSKDGSSNRQFDIITWPTYLSITGDMGSYIFHRTKDMFTFFRNDELKINPIYWAEKVDAEDKIYKVENFSVEIFIENIYDDVVYMMNNYQTLDKYRVQEGKDEFFEWDKDNLPVEILNEIEELLSCQDEWECVSKMRDFNSDILEFDDFWDKEYKDYSYHYIWCCYAIVWAIQKYDLVKGE